MKIRESTALVTVGTMLATAIQSLDATIANVALPYMQGNLSATQDQISWVLTSYIVAVAIMTPATGWITSRFGRKRIFLISVAGFTITSMLCGIATSLMEMVAFRVLQGVFGAALAPLSQSTLLDTYPREKHGQAMSIWALGVTVAPILGPTLGGYLTEYYNWRWVFYINMPLGILAFVLILISVKESKYGDAPRFDWTGFIFLSIAVAALQLFLDRGQIKDWFNAKETIMEAVLAALFFYFFLVHIFTHKTPFVRPKLFADRNFSACIVIIFVIGIILFATLALLPPLMHDLLNYPVMTSGMLIAPRGVGTMIAMFIVGRIINRVDPRALILIGFGFTAFSLWEMTKFSLDIGANELIFTGILQGIGLGFGWVPITTLAFATLEPQARTEAAGLFNLSRNIGSSVGISIVMTILTRSTQQNHAIMVEHINPFNRLLDPQALPLIMDINTLRGVAIVNAEINRQAAMMGYLNDFAIMMWAALIASLLILLLRKPQMTTGGQEIHAVMD
jgi:DHA2 family multidrug resistance protein